MRSLLLGLVIVIMLTTSQIRDAAACSGFPYFGVEDLPTADILVRATIIVTDDTGYRAILRVEEYYKGEGPQFLVVMRYGVGLTSGALVRGYDTGCLYAGTGDRLFQGEQGYFGLRPNGDGTYNDYLEGTAHFYAIDGQIRFQEGTTEGYTAEFDDPNVISEEAFIDLLLQAGDRETPVPPTDENFARYPLMRFIHFTTESGQQYRVNPDRTISEMPENSAVAFSPDGAHYVFREDEQHVVFQSIYPTYHPLGPDASPERVALRQQRTLRGQDAAFANDSSLVAVWDAEQLTIAMITNYEYMRDLRDERSMTVRTIAERPLAELADDALPDVLWSADSTTLAWQDGDGLWVWNIFDHAEPTLLEIPASSTLIDISRHGTYVRYTTDEGWVLQDALTGDQYENAVASPDERFILYAQAPEDFSEGESVTSAFCEPPLRETCTVDLNVESLESGVSGVTIEDYTADLVWVRRCEESVSTRPCNFETAPWHPAIGDGSFGGGRFLGIRMRLSEQVIFDPMYHRFALISGDYDIHLWLYWQDEGEILSAEDGFDVLNLEEQIDSPIASIEWGLPIFYEEFMFTAAENLPQPSGR